MAGRAAMSGEGVPAISPQAGKSLSSEQRKLLIDRRLMRQPGAAGGRARSGGGAAENAILPTDHCGVGRSARNPRCCRTPVQASARYRPRSLAASRLDVLAELRPTLVPARTDVQEEEEATFSSYRTIGKRPSPA